MRGLWMKERTEAWPMRCYEATDEHPTAEPPALHLRWSAEALVTSHRTKWVVSTPGRGTTEITDEVQGAVAKSGVVDGLCTVFCHHSSASLISSENADPSVRRDLDAFFARLVPDGDRLFTHTAEGPDDMSGHLRSILTQSSIGIPVADGRADLGTWQGVFVYEHRTHPHRRRISVVVTD